MDAPEGFQGTGYANIFSYRVSVCKLDVCFGEDFSWSSLRLLAPTPVSAQRRIAAIGSTASRASCIL